MSSREFVRRNHRRAAVASNIIPERDQHTGCIQAGFEKVEARGPIIVVTHIVFARPQQLHRHARQTSPGALVGDQSGDFRDLDVVFVVQAPAEPASRANQMECDIAVLDTGRYRRIKKLWGLARRPDFEFAVLVMSR